MALLIPIRIYNIPHTMGNSIDGGERGGVLILEYMSMLFFVRSADNPPTASAIKIE